jgi:hypothetical protein
MGRLILLFLASAETPGVLCGIADNFCRLLSFDVLLYHIPPSGTSLFAKTGGPSRGKRRGGPCLQTLKYEKIFARFYHNCHLLLSFSGSFCRRHRVGEAPFAPFAKTICPFPLTFPHSAQKSLFSFTLSSFLFV